MLGDTFDLLRTTKWFDVNVQDRPWGSLDAPPTEAMWQKANEILSAIGQTNQETFDLLNPASMPPDIQQQFDEIGVVPESIYIPGNHDRLCALDNRLKDKVSDLLHLQPNEYNFKNAFQDDAYGVYAAHGHSFDEFNYAGSPREIPIGDLITTELIAKLPYHLMKKVEEKGLSRTLDPGKLQRNFQEIENVRPFSATFRWLLYEIMNWGGNKELLGIILDTVDEVIQDFETLPFVQTWYQKHDTLYYPDEADKIQAVLRFFRKPLLPLLFSHDEIAEGVLYIAGKVRNLFEGTERNVVINVSKLFSECGDPIHYIVTGHTHTPLQKAIGRKKKNGKVHDLIYVNSGTWRKRYHECCDKTGFIGWQDMTYVIIYSPEEKPNTDGIPIFESWTGSLKEKLQEPSD